MTLQLDKINPKFREITDLLLFSDRMDLDLSNFKERWKENASVHFDYLWDRFKKSTEIFWENGEQFWSNRLTFLLSLNDRVLNRHIEEFLEKRMFNMVKVKYEVNVNYDIEYLQYLEFCKVKFARKESLLSVKNYLTEMPSHLNVNKLITVVSSFIPMVFENMDEFVGIMSKKITQSCRNYELLIALEEKGIPINREPIIALAKELLMERARNDKNRRAFFTILNDDQVRAGLKKVYDDSVKNKFIEFLSTCDYQILEDQHLRNFKNIVDLDPSIIDEVVIIYADELYSRGTGHKKANADRLIRLLKTIPQIAPKKVLAWLSTNNKMSDIRYILSAFPELKKLAAFV